MPDLVISLTQAQSDRVLAAFQGQFDLQGQPLPPVAAVRRAVLQMLKERVLQAEAAKIDEANNVAKKQQLAVIEGELNA